MNAVPYPVQLRIDLLYENSNNQTLANIVSKQ